MQGSEPHADAGHDDEIEQLLLQVVAHPEAEHAAALAVVCAEHPPLAAALRRRHATYVRLLGLVPEPQPAPAGTRFGEFELLRELGRGGMGVVYLARQHRAGQDRLVALKLVQDRGLMSPHSRERLRREAAAAFRLDDPGLCPVVDAGECDGVPWLAMRYVPGRTLAAHIAAARDGSTMSLPSAVLARASDSDAADRSSTTTAARFASVLALGESLARSLHVAHEAGFVHRDVKPGNVMITPEGQPVLLDFGLVRDETQDHSLTATGETLGTPAYMAPEQIDGREHVDRTADVYSLAATLFEAIALAPPFAGRTREELFRRILQHDIADLRRLVPAAPRDLRVVLATALARERRQRYATALEFALELRRVRRHEPILARPPGVPRRLWLWSLRNRLAAALLLSLCIALGAVVATARDALQTAETARAAQSRAVQNLRSARTAVADLIRVQQTQIDDVPWLEDVRLELQQRAVGLLRTFVAAGTDDPDLVLDTVSTLVMSASLELSMGRLDQALELHAEARRLLDRVAPQPGSMGVRGRWHLFDGELAQRRGDMPQAVRAFEAAATDLLAEIETGGDDDVTSAMAGLERVSEIHERTNDLPAALAAIERCLALRERMHDAASSPCVVRVAAALRQRARLRRADNDLAGADADFRAITTLLAAHLGDHPRDRSATAELAGCAAAHASLLRAMGRGDEQRAAWLDAEQRYERLVAAFPAMPSYRASLAGVLSSRASLLDTDGDHAGALAALARASDLLTAAVAAEPSHASYRYRLAVVLHNRGNRLRDDRAVAGVCFDEALFHLDRLLATHAEEGSFLDLAARSAMNRAIGYAIDGDDRAIELFARAAVHAEVLARVRPNDHRAGIVHGQILFNQGAFLAEHDRLPAAAEALAQAVVLARRSLEQTPSDPSRAGELVRWSVRHAQVVECLQPAAAAAIWQQADRDCAAMAPPLRERLQRGDAAALDACMLSRALAAPDARAGLAEAIVVLADTHRRLAALVAADPRRATARLELCLCLADRAAAAMAAPLADELAALCVQWPPRAGLDRLPRLRLQQRLDEFARLLRDHPDALERLRELAAGR